MTASFPAAGASWIRDVVIGKTLADSKGSLLRECACQSGSCGHCAAGRHDACPTRRFGPHVRPEAYVTDRRGLARSLDAGRPVAVWLSGAPCAWRCSCRVCSQPTVGQLDLFAGQVAA